MKLSKTRAPKKWAAPRQTIRANTYPLSHRFRTGNSLLLIIITLLTFLLCAPDLGAQQKDPQPLGPTLRVREQGKSNILPLARLEVEAKVYGIIAETTMTMTFFNRSHRILEGELVFPLPEGSTVSGYALDINGKMVDGVVVEKKKARVVFEKETRRRIDPGLVEWVKGNTFRTRVYPLPARGSRTIRIRYLSELQRENNQPVLQLPIGFKQRVQTFSLKIEVLKGKQKPTVISGAPPSLSFTPWRDSFIAETTINNYDLQEDLTISCPGIKNRSARVQLSGDGSHYFCIGDLDTGFNDKNTASTVIHPRRIDIFWDASHSMGAYDHQRELDLLERYLSQVPVKHLTLRLVLFRHRQMRPRVFHIKQDTKNRDIATFIRELGDIQYDGGTGLGALRPPAKGRRPQLVLVFTDGNSNFGPEKPGTFKAPVYVFSASATANHPALRHLAEGAGGNYFNLRQMQEKTVINAIGRSPYSFLSAKFEPGALAGNFPNRPGPVGERFVFTGKLTAPRAKVTLNYGYKGKTVKRVTLTLSRAHAPRGEMLRTLWAQKKLAHLSVFPKKNAKQLLELGKTYGLVTPGTSLLVLDNLAQYIEHEIAPPQSLPEMRKQYLSHMANQKNQKDNQLKDKIEAMVRAWNERVAWWYRDFTPPAKKKPAPAKARRRRTDQFIDDGVQRDSPPETEETGFAFGAEGDVGDGPPNGVTGGVLGSPATETEVQAIQVAPRFVAPLAVPDEIDDDALESVGYDSAGAPGQPKGNPAAVLSIKPWNPDTPYLEALKQTGPENLLVQYMLQKKSYGNSPAFFLDCSDFFFKRGQKDLGLQVLSNIAEMELENAALLRVLGHRLKQLGYLELSAGIFEKVLEIRSEEPQSYRDLALVLARQEKYQRAIQLLYHVVTHQWDRFEGIELTALMEINQLIVEAKQKGFKKFDVDPRFIKMLDVDVRVVLTWDADSTDMDLWVIEPTGEKCYYSKPLSRLGGKMSRDFTQGYGPEEYLLKRGKKGAYDIKVNYYGSGAQRLMGAVTLQVDIYTNYGRPNQARKSITLRLNKQKKTITVGDIKL